MNLMELDIEPDAPTGDEIEPDAQVAALAVPSPLVEVLGPDVALPTLIKFVPDVRLRTAVAEAAAYALGLPIDGTEQVARVDAALGTLRTVHKTNLAQFDEPKAIANALHKRISGLQNEWGADGAAAILTLGTRVYTETKRLNDLAAEEARRNQQKADDEAREQARQDAQEAERQHAPAAVVSDLKQRAETATAPPVPAPSFAPRLGSSTPVANWKCRPKGTTGDKEANPDIADMTPIEKMRVRELLTAILAEKAPMQAIAVNWSYCNSRAKADKGAFEIAGLEAFDAGGLRAKGRR